MAEILTPQLVITLVLFNLNICGSGAMWCEKQEILFTLINPKFSIIPQESSRPQNYVLIKSSGVDISSHIK